MLQSAFPPSTLDIGGPAAATLTTNGYVNTTSNSLRVNFGIGASSSDFWTIAGATSLPSSSVAFQFEFQNLGGVKTGVNYPLMSFNTFPSSPPASVFAFAPDMAAAGWAGTFSPSSFGVSVRFTSVPEPDVTALLLLQGAACVGFARWRMRKRRTSEKFAISGRG
jgi:hypothetical protein